MVRRFTEILFAAGLGLLSAHAYAAANPGDELAGPEGRIRQLLVDQLARRYPNARVELRAPLRLMNCALPEEIGSVSIQNENARGEIDFSVSSSNATMCRGVTAFSAWVPVKSALRRVMPGEKLSPETFTIRELDVATGLGREYRGVVLPVDTDLSRLEARQTVLEGQFLMSSAVQKIPDVRRGDSVRVQLISGDLTLSTLGNALEPGYVDGQVKVITARTKRELTGKILAGGVVEVKL